MGVDKSTLSKIESGSRRVDVKEFCEFASAVGQQAGDLLPHTDGVPLRFRPLLQMLDGRSDADIQKIMRVGAAMLDIEVDDRRDNLIAFPSPERKPLSDDAMDRLTAVMRKAGMEPRKAALGPEREVRFYGRASAGDGIEFFDEVPEEYRQIPQWAWKKGARGVFKADGDSMMDVGIWPNDIMFVKPTPQPANRAIVICTVNKKVYVKELKRNGNGEPAQLISKNAAYKPIEITPEDEVEFFGEVVGRTGDL